MNHVIRTVTSRLRRGIDSLLSVPFSLIVALYNV